MAFGWFRRRQKMILIVMAFLMVSFLIGFQGFENFIQSSPGREEIGSTRYGKLVRNDLINADNDLQLLGDMSRIISGADESMFFELRMILGQKESVRNRAFALLLKEAQENGIKVYDQDVTDFFTSMGIKDDKYQELIRQYLTVNRITEQQCRQTVADWLTIHRYYQLNGAVIPPSSSQLVRNFADLAHTITVRTVSLPASKLLSELPATMPSGEQLSAMFEKYKDITAGTISDRSPLGFGYLQPEKAAISCLMINRLAISRVTRPDNNQLMDYYNDQSHAAEFMVPVTPASGSTPASTEKRRQSFAEAAPAIAKKLVDSDVNLRMDSVVMRIQDKVKQFSSKSSELNTDPYSAVVKSMTQSADDILDKPLGMVVFASQPIEDIVSALADKAGLNAICYPWGTHGKNTLDQQIRLSMAPANRTLRQALADLDAQIRTRMISEWPDLHWAKFEMIEKAIFPVADAASGTATQPADSISMFPVQTLKTGLLTMQEMMMNNILGTACDPVNPDVSLADYAFGGKPIGGDEDRKMPSIETGKEGQIMSFGFQETAGSMLWRVTERKAACVPTAMDQSIRTQIEQDIRTEQAYELAKVKAQQISQLADLQKAPYPCVQIGPFARNSFGGNREIFALGCQSQASKDLFVDKAFLLAKGQADYGKNIVVPLPADRMVVVAALVDEFPAISKEYMTEGQGTVVATFKAAKQGVATISGITSLEAMQSALKNEKGGLFNLTVDVRPDTPTARSYFDMNYNNTKISVAPGQTFQIRVDCDFMIWRYQMQSGKSQFHVSDPCVDQVGMAEYLPGMKTLAEEEIKFRERSGMSLWFSMTGISSRVDFKEKK